MAITTAEIMPYICKLDRASRGAGMALRFCPNADQKLALLPSAQPLCSEAYMESLTAESKYNYGELFEKLVTESSVRSGKRTTSPSLRTETSRWMVSPTRSSIRRRPSATKSPSPTSAEGFSLFLHIAIARAKVHKLFTYALLTF